MKIQTKTKISALTINGKACKLADIHPIELEFSAIDTGGGFRDAILDFSVTVSEKKLAENQEGEECDIVITMQSPGDRQCEVTFSYRGELTYQNDEKVEINGRLNDDMLSRELIGFMLHLLR